MNPNELQGRLFLKLYETQITERCLLAQDKRVPKLISSLSPSAQTVGILEFNPHITGILKPRLLNPLHHGNTQTDTFLRIKMLMTVLHGNALMIQNVCKLPHLLSPRGNNNSCRLFYHVSIPLLGCCTRLCLHWLKSFMNGDYCLASCRKFFKN